MFSERMEKGCPVQVAGQPFFVSVGLFKPDCSSYFTSMFFPLMI